MAAASKFNSVVTNPGGTGSTITPTLSTHAAGDIIEIFVTKTGNAGWSAPANWNIRHQTISPGTASTATVGTLLYRRVLPGDTLPLASPLCNLGATVTRHAIARTIRGADVEGVYTLPEWGATGSTSGTNNPIRPPSVTTPAPEMFVTHYYCQRVATNAPEPTNYTQDQQIITSGTLVTNISERTIADQQTTLSNQDVSPTSGGRWVGMISCVPSPDYSYYRAGSQAFNANATSVTPALPTGTTASDNRGNKDLVVLTAQCAGVAPTVNTPAHWTLIAEWSDTTSGGVTTVRKWRAVYTGTLDRQVNRTPSGEIFAYLSVYHNAHQTIPVGTSATQQNASSTTSTFPALTRTGTKATVQATCVADATPTFTAPSGWTERNDSQGVTCADQSFNATGSTASASFTLSSASPTLAGLMEVFSVASVINLILTPASTSIAATTFAPGLITRLTPASSSVSLSTFAPVVSTAAATVVTPAAAALSVSGFAPRLVLVLTPATATLAITPFAPNPITGILYDSATDTNGTDLASHTAEVGGGWAKHASFSDALTIQSNRIGKDGNTGTTVYYADVIPSQLLYTTEADIVDVGEVDRALGIAVYIDTATDSMIVLRRQNRTTVQFLKIVNGSASATLASSTVAFSAGLSRRYTVRRLANNRFEVSLDGVVFGSDIEIADAVFQSPGRIGIRASNNHNGTGYHIDLLTASINASQATTLTPASASLALTTFAPTLRITVVPASAGLTLTTFIPQLRIAFTPSSANLTLTTFAPSITSTVTVPATALSLTTFAPVVTATANVTVTPTVTSLALASFGAQLREVVVPASRSLTLTAFAPGLAQSLTPTAANLSLTTFAPAISTNTILTPASGALVLTTSAPQLRQVLTPNAASLSLTIFAPTVTATANVTATPASTALTTTGFAPALHEQVTPNTSTLTLATFAPEITISADITASPVVQTLTLTQFAPVLQLVITPVAGNPSLSTFAPTITISADQVVTPASASLALTTFAPELTVGGDVAVIPAQLVLALTAFAPTVTIGALVTPVPVTLTLSAFAPWLFLGFVPANRTFMVDLGRYEVEVSAGEYEFLENYEDDEVLV